MWETKKQLFICLSIAVVSVLALQLRPAKEVVAPVIPQKTLRKVYADAYNAGQESGIAIGRVEGVNVGFIEGKEVGLILGRRDGIKEGFIDGYRTGLEVAR